MVLLHAGQAADVLDHQQFPLFLQSQATVLPCSHSVALHHSQAAHALDPSDFWLPGTWQEHPALQLSAVKGTYMVSQVPAHTGGM